MADDTFELDEMEDALEEEKEDALEEEKEED